MYKKSAFGLFVVILASLASAQEPQLPKPQKEHELLKQFVGEWDTESEGSPGPGQPVMKCKGNMTARMLGGFWVVSELKADLFGQPIDALQTVGFDPESKKYVGTWVDSMMGHMWKYQGTVDEAGKILTLEADGPDFTMPGKTAKFRDVYEFKSKDHIVLSSQMQGPDGNWISFMTGQYTRKKK